MYVLVRGKRIIHPAGRRGIFTGPTSGDSRLRLGEILILMIYMLAADRSH